MLLEECLLRGAIDAVGDRANPVRLRPGKTVTERHLAVGRDAKQSEPCAARIRLEAQADAKRTKLAAGFTSSGDTPSCSTIIERNAIQMSLALAPLYRSDSVLKFKPSADSASPRNVMHLLAG